MRTYARLCGLAVALSMFSCTHASEMEGPPPPPPPPPAVQTAPPYAGALTGHPKDPVQIALDLERRACQAGAPPGASDSCTNEILGVLAKHNVPSGDVRDGGTSGRTVTTVAWDGAAYEGAYARCLQQHNEVAMAALQADYLRRAVSAFIWADGAARTLRGGPVAQVARVQAGPFERLMLDALLTALEANGATFVPLEMALRTPAYQDAPTKPSAEAGDYWTQVRIARGLRSPTQLPSVAPLLDLICR